MNKDCLLVNSACLPNHTIVSDVKGRAALAVAQFCVSVAFLKPLLPFTQHIATVRWLKPWEIIFILTLNKVKKGVKIK